MNDEFHGRNISLSDPAASLAVVVPSDAENLATASRALYVGTGGDIALVSVTGDEAVLKGVPGGVVLPIRVAKIRATGTTASDIIAMW